MRNLSPRTKEHYWWSINHYSNSCKKDPEQTDVEDLRNYFFSLLRDGSYKPGSVKMAYYGLKFLFCNIYHKEWASDCLPTPKVAQTLPVVLSKSEVFDVLNSISNFKHRALIMFIYSTGARVSECINVKVKDIDSKRMQINIQEGKGLKQRQVPLSPILLDVLRDYFRKYKPSHFLFEGGGGTQTHLGASAVREICNKARFRTPHITKHYTPHTFRHCFATHHLEQGTQLLLIQRLMGHSHLSNTLKYLHIQKIDTSKVVNPLDSLERLEELCKRK